ncbi:carbohydrate binding domain-containing protein [Microbacterium sp. bgisy189]|uniref:carbohydrate binding domain-containing protein n=1 Tax=Microbacterium sp. bgisy189 TaxID=3413798 RepID=UPI003EBD0938
MSAAETELVTNGDFSQGLTGWHVAPGSPEKLVLREGSRSAYATLWRSGGGALRMGDVTSTVPSAKAGVTYELTAKVRTQNGSLTGDVRVDEVSTAGKLHHTAPFTLTDSTWKTVSTTFTTTRAGAQLNIAMVASDAKAYQPLQVDDVSLRVVSGGGATSPTTPAPVENPVSGACAPSSFGSETDFGYALDIPGGKPLREAWAYAKSTYGAADVVRIFHPGVPNWNAASVVEGADLSVSFKLAPKAVLSGQYDATLRSWFRAAPQSVDVYWTYFHEPEDNIEAGEFTAADYRAAWKRIAAIADETCQPKLHSMLVLMDWTVDSRSGRTFSDYYPGSASIDVLGWDPYNPWTNNTEYRTPASIYDKVIATSKAQGKPFAIAETGSMLMGGDTGAKRASWLRDIASYLDSQGALFVTYFDTIAKRDFRLADAPSKAAWREVVTG